MHGLIVGTSICLDGPCVLLWACMYVYYTGAKSNVNSPKVHGLSPFRGFLSNFVQKTYFNCRAMFPGLLVGYWLHSCKVAGVHRAAD